MRHLEGTPRHQTQPNPAFYPPSVEEYIDQDHLVRVIGTFVD